MMETQNRYVKIIIFVPETHAEKIRRVLGRNGAGSTGNYKDVSFSVKGTGRFRPTDRARPYLGKIGKLEEVTEERIETVCRKKDLGKIISAVKKVHPYEEPAIDAYPLLTDPIKTGRR